MHYRNVEFTQDATTKDNEGYDLVVRHKGTTARLDPESARHYVEVQKVAKYTDAPTKEPKKPSAESATAP